MKRIITYTIASLSFVIFASTMPAEGYVVREGDMVFIIDQAGEKWDVTQAESLGFNPEGFQYGIGRNAFSTLDDSDITNDTRGVSPWERVIGVEIEDDSAAFSVSTLSGHEVSNNTIGGKPVAVGY